MNYRLRKLLGFTLFFLALTGCRIEIKATENGRVTTASGAYECQHAFGTSCSVEINDLYFDEEFIATPDPGFKFVGWKRRDKGLCGGKMTSCKIVSGLAGDNEALIALLESDEAFYLEPVFEPISACGASDLGTSKKITLQQGESAVREIKVPYIKTNIRPSTRTEGCPLGMCAVDVNWDKSVHNQSRSNVTVIDLKFATTSATPIGTYNIQYVSYKRGGRCTPLFANICKDFPDKILKRWKFKLKVVECPL